MAGASAGTPRRSARAARWRTARRVPPRAGGTRRARRPRRGDTKPNAFRALLVEDSWRETRGANPTPADRRRRVFQCDPRVFVVKSDLRRTRASVLGFRALLGIPVRSREEPPASAPLPAAPSTADTPEAPAPAAAPSEAAPTASADTAGSRRQEPGPSAGDAAAAAPAQKKHKKKKKKSEATEPADTHEASVSAASDRSPFGRLEPTGRIFARFALVEPSHDVVDAAERRRRSASIRSTSRFRARASASLLPRAVRWLTADVELELTGSPSSRRCCPVNGSTCRPGGQFKMPFSAIEMESIWAHAARRSRPLAHGSRERAPGCGSSSRLCLEARGRGKYGRRSPSARSRRSVLTDDDRTNAKSSSCRSRG